MNDQLKSGSIWKTRASVLEALEIAIEAKGRTLDVISKESLSLLYELIFQCLGDAKYTTVRESALRVLTLVVQHRKPSNESIDDFKRRLNTLIDSEPSILIVEGLKKLRLHDLR